MIINGKTKIRKLYEICNQLNDYPNYFTKNFIDNRKRKGIFGFGISIYFDPEEWMELKNVLTGDQYESLIKTNKLFDF
jgi:hypothetical protein